MNRFCLLLFNYGVFEVPLVCRPHMTSTPHLETDLALPSKELYDKIEFLPMGLEEDGGGLATTATIQEQVAANTTAEGIDEVSFQNLYPAVIECFVVILCGYAAGRGNLISHTEAKGLNTFVGSFSLPALIFMSMAKLDFTSVNWTFFLAICLSKTLVFILVAIITLITYRPKDFGKAGLFAIFCTQSNDFALGYPIVAALYNKTHPEFAAYLYLVAPISLVLLNPIGFVLMEIGKRKKVKDSNSPSGTHAEKRTCGMCFSIFKGILTNPVVFMTALGVTGNFIFGHQVPDVLGGILKVFGQAFSATALFLLGLSMVGKVQSLHGSGLVAPGILLVVKTLLLPLVTREFVSFLKPGNSANETADFSNYGFLYGTFPTAPSVFVFASQYNVAVDMIASAMVACTFLSAPLMFISAKMITLVHIDPYDYVKELESFLYYVSIVGLVCSVWVIIIFFLSKKWNKAPHFVTLCLAFSQGIACIGALLWALMECNHTWKLYLQVSLFSFGVFSSRLWTAILALTLFLLRWKTSVFVLKLRPYLILFGWGIPAVIVASLIISMQQGRDIANKHDPNFHYGAIQAIIALLLLWFSFFTTIVCLILYKRYEKRYACYESLLNMEDSEDSNRSDRSFLEVTGASSDGNSTSLSMDEDASENDSLFSYDDMGQRNRRRLIRREESYRSGPDRGASSHLTEPEEHAILRDRDNEFQMMRHVVLLLLLCASMIVGCALCMWTLFSPDVNGVYVELVFLDVVLNFGQGFFTAAIFGLDTKKISVTLQKGFRRIYHGAPTIKIPDPDKLPPRAKQVCYQFSNYHMDKCVKDIVRDRRWRLKTLHSVFLGNELVDWLLLVGLAHDRMDAVKYGRCLLQGGLIKHIENLYQLHDQPLFYTFCSADDSSTSLHGQISNAVDIVND